MWTNSDGDQLKDFFKRLSKLQLSDDAKKIDEYLNFNKCIFTTKKIFQRRNLISLNQIG